MKSVGYYIAIFGAVSVLLHFFNLELRALSWIETWGSGVGWAIRIGLIVAGGALWFFGKQQETDVAQP
jgi:hypothetical protein